MRKPERPAAPILRLLTTREVAAALYVSEASIRRLVRDCQLAAVRIRGSLRFEREAVEALVARSRQSQEHGDDTRRPAAGPAARGGEKTARVEMGVPPSSLGRAGSEESTP